MIIVDRALQQLQKENRPIRVGVVGAGFAARGFILQLLTGMGGMRLVAVSNRTTSYAEKAYQQAGVTDYVHTEDKASFEQAVKEGKFIITNDPMLVTTSEDIDVVVEATGEVEFGAHVAMSAIENKKHIVLLNAELDGTLGPILKVYADKAGVIYTQADGDQPAVLMNLFRYVKFMGFRPVMVGNIKSLIDARRTPETQKKWADEHFQRPKMVTSFADGTKISFEMATIANATGFPVNKRGMSGPQCKHVDDAYKLFDDKEQLLSTGLTDYILGAEPSFGVFVLGFSEQPTKQQYMQVYKMGDGPFYTFYVPYHLSPIEAPLSVARAILFKDPTLVPIAGPVTDVVTLAKSNLKQGEMLDGIGGFTCYGAIENYPISIKESLLPMGLTDGCVLKRDIPIDQAITYDDVILPENRLADRLRTEQNLMFPIQ